MRRRALLLGLTVLGAAGVAPMWVAARSRRFALVSGAAPSLRSDSVEQPRLLLVIDDVGHSLAAGRNALALPGPLSCAVLPHSAHGQTLALEARSRGKEVMLHAPMASRQQLALGPGGLSADLDKTEFQRILRADLDAIPHAVGVNNHMGSLLTAHRQSMEWVMEVLRERGLWFVDSRTTADTLAWRVAQEQGVPAVMRDVFLDHEQTREFVHAAFHRALAIAREYGSALMIGHPHAATIDYLHRALPLLDAQGFQRLTVSAFLRQQAEIARLNPADARLINTHRRHWGNAAGAPETRSP